MPLTYKTVRDKFLEYVKLNEFIERKGNLGFTNHFV